MQQSAVFGGKAKDFSIQKCIDSQPEKSLSGAAVARSIELSLELHGCQPA